MTLISHYTKTELITEIHWQPIADMCMYCELSAKVQNNSIDLIKDPNSLLKALSNLSFRRTLNVHNLYFKSGARV